MSSRNGGAAWKLTKSKICLAAGLGGLFHEVVIRDGGERPWILLACLTLCGVASFLRLDDLLASRGVTIALNKPPEPPTPEPLPNGEGS